MIEKQHDEVDNLGILESEFHQGKVNLKNLDHEQKQLLQWALKGFTEEQIAAENKRINGSRSSFQPQKAALESQIQESCEAAVSLPKLEAYMQLVQEKLTTLDFDMKRRALDMLNIKVWLDGSSVEITGTIPVEDTDVMTISS